MISVPRLSLFFAALSERKPKNKSGGGLGTRLIGYGMRLCV